MSLGMLYDLPVEIVAGIKDHLNAKLLEVQKYNVNANGYRIVRPEDAVLGGAAGTYTGVYVNATATRIFAVAATITVPTGQGVVLVGWYTGAYIGANGSCYLNVNGTKRNEASGDVIWNATHHILITEDQMIFVKENDRIDFFVLQNTGGALTACVLPVAFVFGSKRQLLLE